MVIVGTVSMNLEIPIVEGYGQKNILTATSKVPNAKATLSGQINSPKDGYWKIRVYDKNKNTKGLPFEVESKDCEKGKISSRVVNLNFDKKSEIWAEAWLEGNTSLEGTVDLEMSK